MPEDIKITRMLTRVGGVAYELQRLHFSRFRPPAQAWQPAINAYLCEDRFEVCLDLAGVSREELTIQVTEQRLLISGNRLSPEKFIENTRSNCRQILAMEIESGPFSRIVSLPIDVDPDRVRAEQHQGLLWIRLPLRQSGR